MLKMRTISLGASALPGLLIVCVRARHSLVEIFVQFLVRIVCTTPRDSAPLHGLCSKKIEVVMIALCVEIEYELLRKACVANEDDGSEYECFTSLYRHKLSMCCVDGSVYECFTSLYLHKLSMCCV